MRAKGMAFLRFHTVLEQRAENCRIDLRPILTGCAAFTTQKFKFRTAQVDGLDRAKQSAIEIPNALEATASRRDWIVHLAKEVTKEVVSALLMLKTINRQRLHRTSAQRVAVPREKR